MKVSIITICYNSELFLQSAIDSVIAQDYDDIEYIVIDGDSSDGTVKVIQRNEDKIAKWISEPDDGIYDAMNKGIRMASGEIIGILNSDDLYVTSGIISTVVDHFKKEIDAVLGDVFFVSPADLNKPVRRYSARKWHPGKFVWGFMPPHPSFFVRRKHYDKLGVYKTDYKIASDYELLIRFLAVNELKYKYLPIEMVKMRTGGVSTKNWRSNVVLNDEIIRGCKENGLKTNYFMVYSKYFKKIFELISK